MKWADISKLLYINNLVLFVFVLYLFPFQHNWLKVCSLVQGRFLFFFKLCRKFSSLGTIIHCEDFVSPQNPIHNRLLLSWRSFFTWDDPVGIFSKCQHLSVIAQCDTANSFHNKCRFTVMVELFHSKELGKDYQTIALGNKKVTYDRA